MEDETNLFKTFNMGKCVLNWFSQWTIEHLSVCHFFSDILNLKQHGCLKQLCFQIADGHIIKLSGSISNK